MNIEETKWLNHVPKVSTYRGWSITRRDFRGKEHWVANRHGVSMNHPTYEGIVHMVKTKESLVNS